MGALLPERAELSCEKMKSAFETAYEQDEQINEETRAVDQLDDDKEKHSACEERMFLRQL